ncbi:MAG: hypothetical protein MI757_20540 [Pirellulales bacterium]|nr:hypothetical protein [Pirellulales bacterium]
MCLETDQHARQLTISLRDDSGDVIEDGTLEGDPLRRALVPFMVGNGNELKKVSDILQRRVRYAVRPSMLKNGLNRFEIRSAREADGLVLNDLFIAVMHERQ